MKATGNSEVKFLHCLPALHNRDTEIGQRIYAKRGLDALEVTDALSAMTFPAGSMGPRSKRASASSRRPASRPRSAR
jgi:hypothetical protein